MRCSYFSIRNLSFLTASFLTNPITILISHLSPFQLIQSISNALYSSVNKFTWLQTASAVKSSFQRFKSDVDALARLDPAGSTAQRNAEARASVLGVATTKVEGQTDTATNHTSVERLYRVTARHSSWQHWASLRRCN
jgi:hypothetical protein